MAHTRAKRFQLSALRPVFRWDAAFTRHLLMVALPIVVQNLVSSTLHIIDGVMIGHLGEAQYAGVTQATRYTFLFQLFLFGVASGSGIFLSQFWGKKDVRSMHGVMGLCFRLTLPLALLFAGAGILFPDGIMGLFLSPGESFAYGASYLQLVAPGFFISAIDIVYATALKSSEKTVVPMIAGVASIATNTFLNWVLIYGNLGMPQLGVRGAAIATLIAAFVSLCINVGVTYRRKYAAAVLPSTLRMGDRIFTKQYLKTVFPVILNEGLWALGITMYSVFYGKLGDAAVAAVGIYNTIDQLVFVLIYGLMNASSVIVGSAIGAGREEDAFLYAKRMILCALGLGVFMGLVLIPLRGVFVNFFAISDLAKEKAQIILLFSAFFMWIRSVNSINVVGLLRSGGDTVFSLALDIGAIWLVGVPIVGITAMVLHWPVEYVFLSTAIEEAVKVVVGMPRLLSRKWINNLTKIKPEV